MLGWEAHPRYFGTLTQTPGVIQTYLPFKIYLSSSAVEWKAFSLTSNLNPDYVQSLAAGTAEPFGCEQVHLPACLSPKSLLLQAYTHIQQKYVFSLVSS